MPECWIDGFNLFHQWAETRERFASKQDPAFDMGHALDGAIKCLADALGKHRRHTILFLDGGVNRHGETRYGLKTRYPGPGAKADDAMREALQGRAKVPRDLTIVTSDRALATTLRALGAKIQPVEAFVQSLTTKRSRAKKSGSYKTAPLSANDVEAWKEYFQFPEDEFPSDA